MINFKKQCFSALFVAILCFSGGVSAQTRKVIPFQNGKAVIRLNDQLEHPSYWWPKTKLDYEVRFPEKPMEADYSLTDEKSGEHVPFQFSGKSLSKDPNVLVVSLLSDLPSGSKHTFILQKKRAKAFSGITVEKEGEEIIIHTNHYALRIPASQTATSLSPGPVISVAFQGKDWLGRSGFVAGKKKLLRIETVELDSGPIYNSHRISYLFEGGAKYQATVTCVQDYEFAELTEEMAGIEPEDSVSWKLNWVDFKPTHRQAPNHPYGQPTKKPGFERYEWEAIDQNMLNYHHGILYGDQSTGKIPFELGLYQPWPAEVSLTSSVFWDEKRSVGLFVRDAAKWNDQQYAIWHTSRLLNIKFHHKNGLLTWTYPISAGTRQTAISMYDHQKDVAYMEGLEKKYEHPAGFKYGNKMSQLSYNHFLQNRYGTIDLNKVKDWDLSYPENGKIPPVIFQNGHTKSIKDLERGFLYGDYTLELPVSGPRQNSGYAPVPARDFYEHRVDAFNRLYPQMNAADKKRFSAMFLMHAYVAADEEYMPMKYMLSGHPNFLADVKSIPAMAAFLFPDHPQSEQWADQFEKFVELNTRYHTRPSVKSWNAVGGRWTENLGAYVWAFLRPTMRTNYLVQNHHFSLKNRIAGPSTAQLGTWVLNSLSAPYHGESLEFYRNEKGVLDKHSWGVVSKESGPRRVYPPQGAHSLRRQPPSVFWALGESLKNYDPLLAENIQFVSHPDDQDMEALEPSVFKIMYPQKGYDMGTPPDLKSIKLTGYGNILRAKMGTNEEMSVHLTQIDQGPNYRWGRAAEGGNGSIYLFANGNSYSHNGKEDIGDRRLQDTDLLTNFGVFKDGRFKSVGPNVLHRPLYDLGTGQFSEVVPSSQNPYSWPEYQGRSIMLVGADYLITYDDVFNKNIGARFSWFTHPDENLPEIEIIKAGGTEDRNKVMKTEIKGAESKGVWYDGTDDFMVFVSHKKGFQVAPAAFGGVVTHAAGGKDFIFRNDKPIDFQEDKLAFSGTAGFIRTKSDSVVELAVFHGKSISAAGLTIRLPDPDFGISAKFLANNRITGESFGKKGTVTFTRAENLSPQVKLFVDGAEQPLERTGNQIKADFPAGKHGWQLTTGLPVPGRVHISSTEYDHGNATVYFNPVSGADSYLVETSADRGKTFVRSGETTNAFFKMKGASGVQKSHIRVTAFNKEFRGEPSAIYPVYYTREKPHYPDGLKIKKGENDKMILTWGQVLGCPGYRLYKKSAGKKAFELIYSGPERTFEDIKIKDGELAEYVVSAVNKNGESVKSHPVSNDPAGWLIWDPRPGEPFRRVGSTFLGTDNSGIPTDTYYPE